MTIKPIHWETKRLVEVLVATEVGSVISFTELSKLGDMPVSSVKRRLYRACQISLRDHHALVVVIRRVGVQRLGQDGVPVPVEAQRKRIRNSANRGRKAITYGVTDWNKLDGETKTRLYVDMAVLGVVSQATDRNTRKRIEGQVRMSNTEINVGRTLELMK